MRFGRQLDLDGIAGPHFSARDDNTHDARFAPDCATLVSADDVAEQAGAETVDLHTRISQAGDLDNCRRTQPESRADGQLEQRDSSRRDILAEIAGSHFEPSRAELVVQLSVDEMDLAEVGLRGIARNARKVFHRYALMRVVLDAKPFNQSNRRLILLAERVGLASRDSDHG